MKDQPVAIFWFRRDLRWDDNTALYHALDGDLPVLPVFIFDRKILDDLQDRDDARVTFIHRTLQKMNADIRDKHSGIYCVHGEPLETWKLLTQTFDVRKIYYNRDYEPYARQRDETVNQFLSDKGIEVHTFKDHVIHEPDEVLKDDGNPYVVYTPYSRKWREKLSDSDLETHPSALYFNNFLNLDEFPLPGLSEMGFKPSSIDIPADEVADSLLRQYEDRRNFPAMEGTSRLGIHLRFGTISIRKIAARARELSDTFLNELIWREFYQMILFHFPDVVTQNFHRKYDAVKWRNNKEEFQRWCDGQTGYPIVDAGMRQLNKTGFMHNRVRMIVASFLTKHLLIDWRWGEAYFARKLLDYELASNNGGWQWAAGTGTDAQPYFRIFNPYSQTEKFDKNGEYIRTWVPEVDNGSYTSPIVDHKTARQRALDAFKEAVG